MSSPRNPARVLLFAFVFAFAAASCAGARELKVLFIGNSLTACNDMPGTLRQFAAAEGHDALIDASYAMGMPLGYHLTYQPTLDKIHAEDWDYIVLQSNDITAFPELYYLEIWRIEEFKSIIHAHCPETRIIYQMVWGVRNGYDIPGEGFHTYEQYMERIYDGTLHIAGETDVAVAPVGVAWRTTRRVAPDIELFATDNAHPSANGSYLTACVFYAVLFLEELNGSPYHAGLDPDDTAVMRPIGVATVLDDLPLWHLDSTSVADTPPPPATGLYNYPNPFNPDTRFQLALTAPGRVDLTLHDAAGRLVRTLLRGEYAATGRSVDWNGRDDAGAPLPSGVYCARLRLDGRACARRKCLLLK